MKLTARLHPFQWTDFIVICRPRLRAKAPYALLPPINERASRGSASRVGRVVAISTRADLRKRVPRKAFTTTAGSREAPVPDRLPDRRWPRICCSVLHGPHGTVRFKQGEVRGDIILRPQRADLPADRKGRGGLPRPRAQARRRDRRRPRRLRPPPALARHGA